MEIPTATWTWLVRIGLFRFLSLLTTTEICLAVRLLLTLRFVGQLAKKKGLFFRALGVRELAMCKAHLGRGMTRLLAGV